MVRGLHSSELGGEGGEDDGTLQRWARFQASASADALEPEPGPFDGN